MRPRRISLALFAVALFALASPPARAQRQTDVCDACISAHQCADKLQACFLDCRTRFADVSSLDIRGQFDACNTNCNQKLSICTVQALEECRRSRDCF